MVDGPRSAIMTDLLKNAERTPEIDWMSIGIGYDKVEEIAKGAGMTPLKTGKEVLRRIAAIDELDKYAVKETSEAAILVKCNNDYQQQVWTWREK